MSPYSNFMLSYTGVNYRGLRPVTLLKRDLAVNYFLKTIFHLHVWQGAKYVIELTLKAPTSQNGQITETIRRNCLSVFDHYVGLTLKGLSSKIS